MPRRKLNEVEKAEAKRHRSENQRARRAMLQDEEKAHQRIVNAENERNRIANMTDEQRSAERERHANSEHNRIANMTDEQRSAERENNRVNKQTRITNMNNDQRAQLREVNARRVAQSRAGTSRNNLNRTYTIAAINTLIESNVEQHNCGELNVICTSCGAKHFGKERPQDKLFTQCCQKGKVQLENIKVSPEIEKLMTKGHELSANFHKNIRSINSSLAFASMGANIAPPPGYGPYCFRINGQIYHRTGSLHPDNDDQRKFAQLYILDAQEATNQRMRITENSHCDRQLMKILSEFMAQNNPFATACKMLYEVEQECIAEAALQGVQPNTVSMAIVQDRMADVRRYNAPKVNEVAVIFQNADGEPPLERDLIIHCRVNSNDPNSKKTQRISILDPNLEPMVYPLLFPYGDQSWWPELKLSYAPTVLQNIRRPPSVKPRVRVTQKQYYGYRFSIRDEFNPFLSAGKLTQQYFVDAYVKTEANRLNYIQFNQSKLRVEKYTGLMDHLQSEAAQQGLLPGKAVILPSSFQGSPRNMTQNYQDSMAIVRKYGKPDDFVTMTCNPKWPEITENLKLGQSPEFRPDLVARVFKLKLDELLDDISKKHVLGTAIAKVHVIEFQKRGLPHAHILLILKPEDKPNTPEIIDKYICAEIPDIDIQPRLHAVVIKHMIHGPCGELNPNSPCMIDGKCSKNYPKSFQNETLANSDGYPKYRRRNDGKTVIINGKTVDNSWVVPYNPYFLLRYNCHINVESCASIKSVKYLFKYVYKGHDCANIRIEEHNTLNHDEIKTFMDSRYVSAPEAAWRLFGFNMHHQSHKIERLQVHLPDEQNVYFKEDSLQVMTNVLAPKDTTLTAWFKLNLSDENAQDILYPDIPQHYVYEDKQRKWKPRQRGAESTIGRMYSVNMQSDLERFCLRLLLLHVSGATSFDDLKTYQGIVCASFKEAAQKRGLMNDDATWDMTLHEAASEKMPLQLRDLFAYICIYAAPTNAAELFTKYKEHLCEDYRRHVAHTDDCIQCVNFALRDVQAVLIANGKNCAIYGLPTPPDYPPNFQTPDAFFNAIAQKDKSIEMVATLNSEQVNAYNDIISATTNDHLPQRCFFLDGPGGSGKTYLYKTLLSTIRGNNESALPVASTGIAANLLEGGRTYHSQFKLPVPILDNSVSELRMNSVDAKLIKSSKIIILDEATMAPSCALKCINRLLQDIMQNKNPFGGKVLLLGGDFRQTLPVVPHGSRSAIVEASIKFNQLWQKFQILKLASNERSIDPEFSKWLIKLGDGELSNDDGLAEDIIEIPAKHICHGSIVKEIFGEKLTAADVAKFSKMAILCPKNTDVDAINEEVLSILEGDTVTYLSTDSIDDSSDEDAQNYPVEFLNECTPSGMPLHKLNLKKGALIMLLRNLNTKRGLCNGTRLIVKDLKPNLIIAQVLTGSAEGQIVFIPRIDLAPTNTDLPFTLRRRQFPVKLAFAMTINKSQGQTLEKVGIYLPSPVFSHGQLYVAFSRGRCSDDVLVKIIDGPDQGKLIEGCDKVFTRNVVYKEIFSM